MDAFSKISAVYYINLDHRQDRRMQILTELDRLGVPKKKIIRINAEHDLLNGHKGCALSHIKALQIIKKYNHHPALIVEDDCVFDGCAESIANMVDFFFQAVRPQDWDVLLLGGSIKQKQPAHFPHITRITKSFLSHAYIINQNYVGSLLTCFQKSLQQMEGSLFHMEALWTAIDQVWVERQQQDHWFAVEYIAHQRESFSDIDGICRERKTPTINL
jgi:GR25 family glycosyltransferase involved in LPS biosynthesis